MSMHPFARRLRVVTLAVAALLVAACGQSPAETPTDPEAPDADASDQSDADDGDETDGDAGRENDVDALTFTDCEADRYTVGHPEDWNTNSHEGLLGPCEIFHPGDIDEPQQARDMDLHHAVLMYVDEVDFATWVSSDNLNEVLEEREATVDGRSARAVEYRSTGHSLTPEGERSYTWVIDLDGEILVATTSSVGDTDYERDQRILDRMVTDQLTIRD